MSRLRPPGSQGGFLRGDPKCLTVHALAHRTCTARRGKGDVAMPVRRPETPEWLLDGPPTRVRPRCFFHLNLIWLTPCLHKMPLPLPRTRVFAHHIFAGRLYDTCTFWSNCSIDAHLGSHQRRNRLVQRLRIWRGRRPRGSDQKAARSGRSDQFQSKETLSPRAIRDTASKRSSQQIRPNRRSPHPVQQVRMRAVFFEVVRFNRRRR
jgi:hypothetical protein